MSTNLNTSIQYPTVHQLTVELPNDDITFNKIDCGNLLNEIHELAEKNPEEVIDLIQRRIFPELFLKMDEVKYKEFYLRFKSILVHLQHDENSEERADKESKIATAFAKLEKDNAAIVHALSAVNFYQKFGEHYAGKLWNLYVLLSNSYSRLGKKTESEQFQEKYFELYATVSFQEDKEEPPYKKRRISPEMPLR